MGSSSGFPGQSGLPNASGPGASQPDDISYVKEAFKIQYNWITLAGLGALAVITGSALPLILAGGLELMYLAVVPQNWRFQRLVRSWHFAAEQQAREKQLSEMLRALPPDMQTRYVNLAQVCGSIRSNFGLLFSSSQIFVQQMDQRLQGLLNGYARLLNAAAQQRQYLKTSDADAIKKEIAALQQRMDHDPPKVQEINRKRIEILSKRTEKFGKIRENCAVIEAQCGATEDVLQLIRDQSVTLRDPQQVSDQLESLVHDVEQTEQTVHEVQSILEMGAPDTFGTAISDGAGGSIVRPGNRLRN